MDSRWSLREEVHLNQRKKIIKYIITFLGIVAHELLLIYLHYIVWQNKKNHFNGCVLHLAHKLMDRSKQHYTNLHLHLLPSLLGVALNGVCRPSLDEWAVDGRLDELEGRAAVNKNKEPTSV